MQLELTIEQAKQHPANFLYVFATTAFLSKIESKYATIISGKRTNQQKVLLLSAQKFINKNAVINGTEYNQYKDAIRSAFVEAFAMQPEEALVKLAMGENVAGKNWSEGVYGVGALTDKFSTGATVDPTTGMTFINGHSLGATDSVVKKVNGEPMFYQIFCTDTETGITYMSQLKNGKYYAKSYSDNTGKKFSASGSAITDWSSATVWEDVILNIQTFINWLLTLFGINTNSDRITAENTLPSQSEDGFVTKVGVGEAGAILLALAGAGVLLGGGLKPKKSKRK